MTDNTEVPVMPTTDQHPTDAAQRRSAFVRGLRALANFYVANPEFPLPYLFNDKSAFDIYPHDVEVMAGLVRQIGGKRVKDVSEHGVGVKRDFGGGVILEVFASREKVCTPRVVGTEKKMVPAPDAPLVEQDIEIVEWDCHPILDTEGGGGAS